MERISAFAAPARSGRPDPGRRTSVFLVLCVLGLLSFGTTWIVGQLAQTGSFSIMTILVGRPGRRGDRDGIQRGDHRGGVSTTCA